MSESMQTQLKAIYPKVYKPLIERTWLWIKDHPGLSSAEISRDLGEKISHVSSILTSLKNRKMVHAFDKTNTKGRTVAHFTVERRMFGEYSLWPLPVKNNHVTTPFSYPSAPDKDHHQEATPPDTSMPVGMMDHQEATDPLQWVEHLTWKELRLLTARLNQVMSSL